MDISGIVLQGLQQATAQLEKSAIRIAAAGDTSVEGAGLDVVDLSAEVVALMSAQSNFASNIQTMKTADEMQKTAINLIG